MGILIVDSASGSDLNTRAIFEDYGYHSLRFIKSAVDLHHLLQQASALSDIRLVIINSELAGADGFELCRELRATEWGRHIYIIMLISSMGNKIAIDKARHSGANSVAAKPYDGDQFRQQLADFSAKHTVLLVEDDPVASQLVCKIFTRHPVEMVVLDDGLKAYNQINSMVPPALVLLDIGLPNMNGLKLLKHVRTRQGWKNLPVIMLTSSTDIADVKTSLGMGANDYIVKPFRLDEFARRIDKFLSMKPHEH